MNSMSPNLVDGDRVLVFRYWPKKLLYKNQIVIIWPTPPKIQVRDWLNDHKITPYIKRITGLPGEVKTTYLSKINPNFQEFYRDHFNEFGRRYHFIREGYIFVEGDNPYGGLDSNYFGQLSKDGVLVP